MYNNNVNSSSQKLGTGKKIIDKHWLSPFSAAWIIQFKKSFSKLQTVSMYFLFHSISEEFKQVTVTNQVSNSDKPCMTLQMKKNTLKTLFQSNLRSSVKYSIRSNTSHYISGGIYIYFMNSALEPRLNKKN